MDSDTRSRFEDPVEELWKDVSGKTLLLYTGMQKRTNNHVKSYCGGRTQPVDRWR